MLSNLPKPIGAILFAGFLLALPAAVPLPLAGDVSRGKFVYDDQCTACHALDVNRFGPAQRSVYGAKAGQVRGYAYTAKMKASGIVWTEANLNRFIADSQAMLPGTRMEFVLPDAKARADVIAYLKKAKNERR